MSRFNSQHAVSFLITVSHHHGNRSFFPQYWDTRRGLPCYHGDFSSNFLWYQNWLAQHSRSFTLLLLNEILWIRRWKWSQSTLKLLWCPSHLIISTLLSLLTNVSPMFLQSHGWRRFNGSVLTGQFYASFCSCLVAILFVSVMSS